MRLISTLLVLLALAQSLAAQTRADSISGRYERHTWTGVGNTHLDYGNGTSAEVSGYTISTTDEILQLDKNRCAALTVNTEQGHYVVSFLLENPIVYYGMWKMVGDTVVITYTRKYAKPTFVFGMSGRVDGIIELEQPMQRKYLYADGRLTSLEPGDNVNYLFYKEEELIQ
jgi:hypothetical protein